MKKLLSLLLAMVMVFSVAACGTAASPATEVPAATEAPAAEEPAEPEAPAGPDEATIAALGTWADDLFEPETTVTLPATIGWKADASAVEVAGAAQRPNTMFVAIDADLKVSTMAGEPISDDLAGYLASVKSTTLAALYISDQATADAFDAFATEYAVGDVFVVASSENAGFVNQICDHNVGILGIIDWTGATLGTTRAELLPVIQNTNANHAKIALIPESIATIDTVEYLRAMLISVWVETSPDTAAIYTQLTNGANGIVCEDYQAVIDALESFNDKTTLLRHVFITGHRGLPSQYVENTIRSERAAIEAGANVIECDVSESSDGVLFVLHDDSAARLFNRPDIENVEEATIDELTSMPYDMTDDTAENAPNSVLNSNNTNRTTPGREDTVLNYDPKEDHIPTLEEYLTALNDEDVFHFIEIKSYRPAIVPKIRDMVKSLNMEDRVCIITFNDGTCTAAGYMQPYDEACDVIAGMRKDWPEMSCGYLGMSPYDYYGPVATALDEEGVGAALKVLYGHLQPNNNTVNDYNAELLRPLIFAGRHRGLTSWFWTYNDEAVFANHYLTGMSYSLTTNFSNWATNFPVRIVAEDAAVKNGDAFNCQVIAQNDEVLKDVEGLSLVSISGVPVSLENGKIVAEEAGEAVVLVRLDTVLDVNGVDVSESVDPNYAIYSNPITLTVG